VTGGAPRPGRSVTRDSPARRIVVDAGAAAARRHAIPAWFAADVTDVLPRLGRDAGVSVSAYVASTLAHAVAAHPRLHAIRDPRGRVVTFDSVDVNMTVEITLDGQSFPMNHVLRGADTRSAADVHREIHEVKADPGRSETLRMSGGTQWYLRVPAPVRQRVMMGTLHRLPSLQRRLIGTVGLTSVGMHGSGSGLGVPFLLHTLDVLVGGLEDRPGFAPDGQVVPRQYLWVSMVVDHDVVDGVPLARFIVAFRDGLESGAALEQGQQA
jgi:pyruvate/2-oxoglutarate dehydrogenase complex dihydrolipoamide acyltransferase (E2) component